jgi:hypothetical protein
MAGASARAGRSAGGAVTGDGEGGEACLRRGPHGARAPSAARSAQAGPVRVGANACEWAPSDAARRGLTPSEPVAGRRSGGGGGVRTPCDLLTAGPGGRLLFVPKRRERDDDVGRRAQAVLPRARGTDGGLRAGEHVFGSVGGGSDGRGGVQEGLHVGAAAI